MHLLSERGGACLYCQWVYLVLRGTEPPGSRLPLQLASIARGFTLQHISDRMNLVCAQHNLGAPSKVVSQLMMLGFEVSTLSARVLLTVTHSYG